MQQKKINRFVKFLLLFSILFFSFNSIFSQFLTFEDNCNYNNLTEAQTGGWIFGGTNPNKFNEFNGTHCKVGVDTTTLPGVDSFLEFFPDLCYLIL